MPAVRKEESASRNAGESSRSHVAFAKDRKQRAWVQGRKGLSPGGEWLEKEPKHIPAQLCVVTNIFWEGMDTVSFPAIHMLDNLTLRI